MGLRSRCLTAVMLFTLGMPAPSGAAHGRVSGPSAASAAIYPLETATRPWPGLPARSTTLPAGLAAALRPVIGMPSRAAPGAPDVLLQQATLTGPNGQAPGSFGSDVALSADGNTALVGASGWNNLQGAAYVFVRSGAQWTEQAMLTAAGGVSDSEFGNAVSLSDDGNTALIGAVGAAGGNGGAYIFVRSGTSWSEQITLNNPDYVWMPQMGRDVALSGDGNTAVIGVEGKEDVAQGIALVFARNGTDWPLQALIALPTLDRSYFGFGVAVSTDGNLALIGAPGKDMVYVYTRTGTSWSEQTTISPIDGSADDFLGSAMALSEDASVALVSAFGENQDTGAVFVFVHTASGWSEQAKLVAQPPHDLFGIDVALSADGNSALIGADAFYPWNGAAYLFTRSGTTWSEQAAINDPGQNPSQLFGLQVALSRDGRTALVGAIDDDTSGAVYVYAISAATASTITVPIPAGWSLITQPLSPTGNFSAASILASVLQSGKGRLAALYQLTGGQWAPPLIEQANGTRMGQDFSLQVSRAYLLYSDAAGNYTETGYIPAIMPDWTLGAGWNLVGLPEGTRPISASAVLAGVLTGSTGAAAIYGLTGGRWSPSLMQQGSGPPTGQDFALEPGSGYLLYTDRGTDYMPGQPAPVYMYRAGDNRGEHFTAATKRASRRASASSASLPDSW